MKTNYRQTTAQIDLTVFHHNIDVIRNFAPSSKLMAVIKSNGYGHGMLETAQAIQNQVDAFAVSSVDEAILLRDNNITKSLVILEGFQEIDEIPVIEKFQLIPVIHQHYQLDLLKDYFLAKSNEQIIPLWIKLDSGMNRLGFKSEDIESLSKFIYQFKGSIKLLGFISHFACADEPEHFLNQQQELNFKALLEQLFLELNQNHMDREKYLIDNYQLSFSNSAAILTRSDCHYHWVRPGIILYGINPLIDDKQKLGQSLIPAMTFTAKIIAIKKVSKGDSVGYGASFKANTDKTIVIIAAGYGDGYPRHAKPGTPMMVNDHRIELLGRVSMDMICADISRLDEGDVNIGDSVELWGKSIAVEQVARYSDTIAYELVCGISSRVQYIYQE